MLPSQNTMGARYALTDFRCDKRAYLGKKRGAGGRSGASSCGILLLASKAKRTLGGESTQPGKRHQLAEWRLVHFPFHPSSRTATGQTAIMPNKSKTIPGC